MSWFRRRKSATTQLLLSPATVERIRADSHVMAKVVATMRAKIHPFNGLGQCPKCQCTTLGRKLDERRISVERSLPSSFTEADKQGWAPGVTWSMWASSYGSGKTMIAGGVTEVLTVTCPECGYTLGDEWPADHPEEP